MINVYVNTVEIQLKSLKPMIIRRTIQCKFELNVSRDNQQIQTFTLFHSSDITL